MPLFKDNEGNIVYYTEEEKEQLKKEGLGIDGEGGHWLVIDNSQEKKTEKKEPLLKPGDPKVKIRPLRPDILVYPQSQIENIFGDPEDEDEAIKKREERGRKVKEEEDMWGGALQQWDETYNNDTPYLEPENDPIEDWRQQNEELLMLEREGFIEFDKW